MPPATFDVAEVNGKFRLIRTPVSARQRDLIKRMRALSLDPAPVTKPAAPSPPSTQNIIPLNSPSKRQADFEHYKNDECPSKRRSPRLALHQIGRITLQRSQPSGPFFRLLDLPAEIRNLIWKFANPKTPKCCCDGLWWHKVGDMPRHTVDGLHELLYRHEHSGCREAGDVIFAYGKLGRGVPINRQILRESRHVAKPVALKFAAFQNNLHADSRMVEIEGDIQNGKLVLRASMHSLRDYWSRRIEKSVEEVKRWETEVGLMVGCIDAEDVNMIEFLLIIDDGSWDENHQFNRKRSELQIYVEKAKPYLAKKRADVEQAKQQLHTARSNAFKYGAADFEFFQNLNERLESPPSPAPSPSTSPTPSPLPSPRPRGVKRRRYS
ncbi:uncharacterized protein AB675_11306 [Cyphellophora attinorum]|uniref:Uncharacterized protein n=1 Tax=Cyphellophora attinorum TaxID=1664694 RepID=A0A0N1NZ52_9EURO|nr:uncharacterized protein AB675_11306 [Phialophora attinorum]KPI39973.1 hypothetical protein AB675_11306 [Phialophora attinorum]